MAIVHSLTLHNFRSYAQARLDGLRPGLVVLSGPNGAGKTNILEALSLLSPGRGLRGVRPLEIQNTATEAQTPWAVAAVADTQYGAVNIGTGLDAAGQKRVVRIKGQNAKSQNALADYVACVWLSPQMDRLFHDGASARRRFLDRLVYAFDPSHAGRMTRYENALRQRAKILHQAQYMGRSADPTWLNGLEQQIAQTGVAIAAARLECAAVLDAACRAAPQGPFPQARLSVHGTIENLLAQVPALEVERLFTYQLQESRTRDAVSGGAATGPHKSDLVVIEAASGKPAQNGSTGEQKALLIGLILAHARLIASEQGRPPLLLLDEIAAHLDEGRRNALYDVLQALGGQIWLSGTEENLFSAIANTAQFLSVTPGHVRHASESAPIIPITQIYSQRQR